MAERASSSWGTGTAVQERSSWDTDWDASWESPTVASATTANVDPFDPWGFDSQPQELARTETSSISERLREYGGKLARGLGRRALGAVMNRLPRFASATEKAQNVAISAYENPGQFSTAIGNAQNVLNDRSTYMTQGRRAFGELARDSAMAAKGAAIDTVKDYYGIETNDETGERKIRKLKLARAAVKTVVMPVGVGTKVARKAAVAGAKEAFATGRSGFSEATRATFAQPPSPYESSSFSNSGW